MPHILRFNTAALTRRVHARFAGSIARRRQLQVAAQHRRALLRLDDHLLRDIGLDPRQVRVNDGIRFGLPI